MAASALGSAGVVAQDGCWALLVAGAVLARTGHEIVPARYDGGPDPSFLSGLVWGALMAAAAGDRGLGDRTSGEGPLDPVMSPERVDAERAAAGIPVGLAQARDTVAAAIAAELALAAPGASAASAGVALGAVGTWLADDAAGVCAPLTRRRGLWHGALRYATEGCALAGGLLAACGLQLLG